MKPSHPQTGDSGRYFTKQPSLERSGITAAGTVADSNRIPFSLQCYYFIVTPIENKDKLIFYPETI
jgi:hypothetical protein